MNKIASGIIGLDNLVHGGLPKGRAYLVSGEPGTGKTIFSLQFLLEGLNKGEKCIYISIDEKPEHIILDSKSLGWDLTPHLESGLLQILDVTSYFSSLKDNLDTGIEAKRIVEDILSYVKKSGAQRLAIDPIAPLIFKDSNYSSVVEYIRTLIFEVEDNMGCTTVLTSYVPVGSEKISAMGIEEFAASGIVLLKLCKTKGNNIRTISVRKMRGTAINLAEYSFEILKDRGIVLRQPI
jgi:circadian clock protein KaiC